MYWGHRCTLSSHNGIRHTLTAERMLTGHRIGTQSLNVLAACRRASSNDRT